MLSKVYILNKFNPIHNGLLLEILYYIVSKILGNKFKQSEVSGVTWSDEFKVNSKWQQKGLDTTPEIYIKHNNHPPKLQNILRKYKEEQS